jgi:hypothetical protein
MYFISTLGRTKLHAESIEQIEQSVRAKLEAAGKEMDKTIDGAELPLKQNNIEVVATYDTVPLEIEIGITSALGRRYFELIHKLDQTMPLIQTLEIEEVITEKHAAHQRSNCKRIVLSMSSGVRNLAMGVRRRMNEADAKLAGADDRRQGRSPAEGPSSPAIGAEAPTESGHDGVAAVEGAQKHQSDQPSDSA